MNDHEDAAFNLDRAGPLTRVEALPDGLLIIFQRMRLKVPEGYVAEWRGRPPITSAERVF